MKKKFLTGIMIAAMAMSAAFGVEGTMNVSAEGLTQIENPADVVYGKAITGEDKMLVFSLFDMEFYLNENPDVRKAAEELLKQGLTQEQVTSQVFEHFCAYGLYEGRSVSENFNVSAFASAYSDLKDAFGSDILAYYKYAATHDLAAEGRTITTLKAAAEAGVTVSNVLNPEIQITPAGYYYAEELGIRSIQVLADKVTAVVTVNTAVNYEKTSNNVDVEVVIEDTTSTGSYIDAAHEGERQLTIDKINKYYCGTINKNNNNIRIYIVKDKNLGMAVYSEEGIKNFASSSPISCTSDYDSSNVDLESKSFIKVGITRKEDNGEAAFEVEGFGSASWDGMPDTFAVGTWFSEETVNSAGKSTDLVYHHIEYYNTTNEYTEPLNFIQNARSDGEDMHEKSAYKSYEEITNNID